MALYEYRCPEHGLFERIQSMDAEHKSDCPECGTLSSRVFSTPAPSVMVERERLPLGTGAKGRYVSGKETGGSDIFVPSFGAMEQSEVDDITTGAVEKEKSRVHKRNSKVKEDISNLMNLASQTKPKERLKTLKEAMG